VTHHDIACGTLKHCMKPNLDSVHAEIEEYLESRGIAVFHAFPGTGERAPAVHWNTDQHPDYRDFLSVAEAAAVRMVALHANEFQDEMVDEALESLAQSSIAGPQRASIERRMRDLRRYDGYTCQIELSFDLPPRVYVFDLRTEWFQELSDMLDEIDDARPDLPDPPGYFSKN
jgi:hypothetical protein